jgi:anthranilate phosphoribosyltransferase
MDPVLGEVVRSLIRKEPVSAELMERAVGVVMDGSAGEVDIASLLTAWAVHGETTAALLGAARAMRARSTRIPCQTPGLLDTCGTGGDGLHTFNISTAAAIVASAAGAPVAKHGNRSVSSSSGSADVLEQLGVNLNRTPEQVARSIDAIGLGFCFAPLLHGAMKHAAPVRKALGFRTLFNLLGPLTNPAGARFQIVGASRVETASQLAATLQELGGVDGLVVCGNDELDEVSLWGTTTVFRVSNTGVATEEWTAETFGLPGCLPADIRVASAKESADVVRGILEGKPGAARNMVVANAAAALVACGKSGDPREGVELASQAIDQGLASSRLRELVEFSRS